jgi:hypothetical protein
MSVNESAKGTVASQLRQAVERLHSDIERVEFWATALDQMAQPIPEYDAAARSLSAFNLPSQSAIPGDGGSSAASTATNDVLPTTVGSVSNRR